MLHSFSRTELLIGTEGLNKLMNSTVAIFGVGGVGGFVIEGLARCGVGKFVLVDNDTVCLTNINRQIIATHNSIGRSKVEVAKDRILEINPKAEIEIHQTFYLPENAQELIRNDYDYIVDAIDTVTAKIDLVVQAKNKQVPIICSMGMGNKLDPGKIKVTDLAKTSIDPLARVMRKELKKRDIVHLKVVCSTEEPIKPLEIDAVCSEDCNCSNKSKTTPIKRQTPGSISFVPSVAGLMIASEVAKDLMQ